MSSVEQFPTSLPTRKQIVDLLKSTVPFEPIPDELLAKIADVASLVQVSKDEVVYQVGEPARELYVVASGQIEHKLGPGTEATVLVKVAGRGDVIGWAAVLKGRSRRLAKTTAVQDSALLKIEGDQLMEILSEDPEVAQDVLSRYAKMIIEDFTVPPWLAQVQDLPRSKAGGSLLGRQAVTNITGLSLFMFRFSKWLQSPKPYLMLIGFALFFGAWFFLSEVIHFWRFDNLPGPREILVEWFNPNPIYGLSFYTPEYYTHIWMSVRRVAIAFAIATGLGVPVGLFLGWSKGFREFVFPVFETLRPIPVLAWVPLAIVMFVGTETPVIFLATLASFYATALNTMLGVESVDDSYPRAAACLGATKWQIFRHIVIPGALPYVFTGLQISVGVAWFSLVAAEMVSGEFGLGYVINTSYTMVRYPTIVIGMITLGIVGYVTSAMVRIIGDYLMQWRVRELALGEQ